MSTPRTTILATVSLPGDDTQRPTRTHASSRLAFPKHAEYACALEIHRPRLRVDDWVGMAAAGALGLAAMGFWLAPLIR